MQPKPAAHPAASPLAVAQLRPATLTDMDRIHGLIEEASRTSTVLSRSIDSLCKHTRDFVLAEAEGQLVGCCALALITQDLAEIRTLVVVPEQRGQGLGRSLIKALLSEARRLGVRRVFALTDNVPFFTRLGFSPVDKETLPHKIWNECIRCSKFLHCTEEAVHLILSGVGGAAPGDGKCDRDKS